MNDYKFHCKYAGKGYWEVFVTEDSWDTFSFMMFSDEEPSRKDIQKVWRAEEKESQRVF